MSILKIKDWIKQGHTDYCTLKLDKRNLSQWKRLVNIGMYAYDEDNYTDHLFDDQWLHSYCGMTPFETVQEELENGTQD